MLISRRKFNLQTAAVAITSFNDLQAQPTKLSVLVIDGINNHDWRTATAAIRAILTRTGRFNVEVSTTPPREAAAGDWDSWRPIFAGYDVVINNFNGGDKASGIQWPARVNDALDDYVKRGGGLVSFHAANNAFLPWHAYNEMIGLGWREKTFGRGIKISEQGEVVIIPKGEGLGPGHPDRMDFQLHVRKTNHIITRGMPPVWMHPCEQLTHGQHGPAEGLTILTYAHSPVSLANEPMDWCAAMAKAGSTQRCSATPGSANRTQTSTALACKHSSLEVSNGRPQGWLRYPCHPTFPGRRSRLFSR